MGLFSRKKQEEKGIDITSINEQFAAYMAKVNALGQQVDSFNNVVSKKIDGISGKTSFLKNVLSNSMNQSRYFDQKVEAAAKSVESGGIKR